MNSEQCPQGEGPLTPAGWPRPIFDGWPVPWISPAYRLAIVNGQRKHILLNRVLCQVCGCGHDWNDRVIFCVNIEKSQHKGAPDASVSVWPIDNAVMHERCAKLSLKQCPKLIAMRSFGHIIKLSAERRHVKVRKNGPFQPERQFVIDGEHCTLDSDFNVP